PLWHNAAPSDGGYPTHHGHQEPIPKCPDTIKVPRHNQGARGRPLRKIPNAGIIGVTMKEQP
ncbi:MAG: hypothetical protein AAGK98_18970, partial [Pseudomonadota bacterium]